jgi:nitroreductase
VEKLARTKVAIDPLLARRWSPRAFSSRQPGADHVDSLLEAARWAPSCFNAQPWRFVVARADEPERHARVASLLSDKNRRWAAAAPVLMVTIARRDFDNGKPNAYAWHDVGLAMGNLLTQATSLGLVVHQMAGFDKDRARVELALPDGYDPVAMVAIGFPGDPAELPDDLREREAAPRVRKPLDELVLRVPSP